MKHLLVLAAAMLIFPAVSRADTPRRVDGSWGGALHLVAPDLGNLDVYDRGVGIEAMARFWAKHNLGWSVSLGAARWETASNSRHWGAPVDGELTLFPVGLSALWRPTLPGFRPVSSVILEVGLRYVITDADLSLRPEGTPRRASVSVDDGIVGVLGIDWERPLEGGAVFFLGAAYQADLVAAKARWSEGRLRDNDLEAFMLRTGFRFPF